MASITQTSFSEKGLTKRKHQKAENQENEESGLYICSFYPLQP